MIRLYYLSRVEIDVLNRQRTHELTHLGAYHNWVEQSFPAEVAAKRRSRKLWRIDSLLGKRYLLILSESAPDLTKLGMYGVPGTAQTKPYDDFLAHLQTNQIVRFRLTANPTHTIESAGRRQGRIVPHITVEQQRQWLADRAEKAGFRLLNDQAPLFDDEQSRQSFNVVGRDWPALWHGHRFMRLSRVTYEGRLQITDLSQFRQTMTKGLGREKAYGMGLLTVIPEG